MQHAVNDAVEHLEEAEKVILVGPACMLKPALDYVFDAQFFAERTRRPRLRAKQRTNRGQGRSEQPTVARTQSA